jgi:diacylglycerol kinase family enzyme
MSSMITTPVDAELARLSSAVSLTPRAGDSKLRMFLVVNPRATTVSGRLKNLVVYALQGRYDVHAVETEGRDHATALTREAIVDQYDLVVAFGGDGTLNEVANGLAHSGVPLTILPGGCTNVACRMLGIPTDIVDATEHLLQLADGPVARAVDLGSVNGRYFVFSSGAGLDADATRWVDERRRLKARGRVLTFGYAATAAFLRDYRGRPPRLCVEARGERVEGVSAFVQNSRPFTYARTKPLHVCEDVALDSGTISAMVMQRAGMREVPGALWRLFREGKSLSEHPRARSFPRIAEARVTSLKAPLEAGGEPLRFPLEVDGDYLGEHTEAVYGVAPGALRVIA